MVKLLARGRLGDPAFTPDGERITYWSANSDRIEGGSLQQVGVESGEIEEILPGEDGEYSDPTWSPTGDRLLATRLRGSEGKIVAIDLADGAPAEVTPLTTDGTSTRARAGRRTHRRSSSAGVPTRSPTST